jgi:exopolysaccharide biosynthesis polyprenyl glycosylphosphotransferase
MISTKWRIMKHTAKLYDMCVLIGAFLFTTFVLLSSPKGLSLSEFMSFRIKLGNCLLFALLLVAWHNLFVLGGLYTSKRLTKRSIEAYGVAKATLLASAFLILMAKVLHIEMVSVPFVFILWVVCTSAMVSGRIAARSLLLILRSRGRNSRFLLIVGTNERAIEFGNTMRMHPELGYQIVGFVDDDWPGIQKFEASGHTRCCSFSGLANFLRQNVVDEAAIYLPLRSYYEHAAELVSLCEHHGIVIRVDSQIFNLRNQDPSPMELDANSQVVTVADSTGSWPVFVKRLIDCFGSAVALILLAPVLLVVGLLVKFTSEGPVFFRQTRVGLNKRMFSIYKFRTMIADAEKVQDQLLSMNEMTGPVFKIKHDPRVTPLGRILRNTSIDELPQLLNVLKGEMSLVGPRAMSLRDYELFDNDWHRRRFSVKPGITCLWQVKGRNSIPFEQWMELDLQYIDKWSLWLDLKILAQTVPAVLRGTGAA